MGARHQIHDHSLTAHDNEPDGSVGPIVTRASAPGLFAMLDHLALATRGGYPSEVRVSYLPACGVLDLSERSGYPRRVLIVGLPCFQILSEDELRATLAHEIAHLKLEDAVFTRDVMGSLTGYARPRAPGQSMVRTFVVSGAASTLLALAAPLARWMELRADRWSAGLCGEAHLSCALIKIAVVQSIFREVLSLYDPESNEGSGAPAHNVYQYFESAWRHIQGRPMARLAGKVVHGKQAFWREPHPSMAERIAQLGSAGIPDLVHDSSLNLLEKPSEWMTLMHNRLYGSAPPAPTVFKPALERGP